MTKRAGIYVRTSSERQGEKVSPQAQEDDSRAYCESKGYLVVDVYKDIKRYRSGRRLVEPSGARHDRPEFQRMLKDSDGGVFDVLVAWREDRLYRGVNRAMLEINERVTQKVIGVELVKEHYDPTVAAVKAWAAGVELQAKKDRLSMGIAARLSKGKSWNQRPPYGYSKDDEGYNVINPDEAKWVRCLFEWFAEGVSVLEIRKRFISGGAKQRTDNTRWTWNPRLLYKYLSSEYYWIGYQEMKWDDTTYKTPIEPIVSPELAQRASDRKIKHKRYPAGNAKHTALAAGLVRCAGCGNKMTVTTHYSSSARKDGKKWKWVYYGCPQTSNQMSLENCAGRIAVSKIDEKIWAKVWKLISEPGVFEASLQKRIAELQEEEIDAQTECEKLESVLDNIVMERQKVITYARKDMISEDDLATQLLALEFEENAMRRDLESKKLLIGDRAESLMRLANAFREQVKAGIEGINSEPDIPEKEKQQLEFRKKIVHSIVKKVEVGRDREVSIDAVLSLPESADISVPSIY